MTEKLPISAIIVGYNESRFLPACFAGVSFCNEILYFDLGSSDNSIEIASNYGATVVQHERVLSCEWIHAKFVNKTKHEWVLITDPDEVVDFTLAAEISEWFKKGIPSTTGALLVPWLFYFKNHRLKGTAWGGANKRVLLVHNQRFSFTPQIHVGRKLNEGFEYMDMVFKQSNAVHHYWMQGYSKLLEKHLRYLKNEGAARYANGARSTVKQILMEPYRQFRYSFFTKKGFKDGLTGLFLSAFWAWYQTRALIALYKHSKASIK
jgi:glycosyltransferase involved in cell wall biosynthesis